MCLVITDGKASDTINIEAARKKWLKEGVLLYAIGLGEGIDEKGENKKKKTISFLAFREFILMLWIRFFRCIIISIRGSVRLSNRRSVFLKANYFSN